MPELGLIWAEAHGRAIGRDGVMPWHLPEDLAHFRETTAGDAVIMGRRTWESLPKRFRPLPSRRNLVVTRNAEFDAPGAEVVTSLDDAVASATNDGSGVWIIGGGELYRTAMPIATTLVVTEIDLEVTDADTFAPVIGSQWQAIETSQWHTAASGLRYRFVTYRRSATPESGTLEG